MTREEIIKAFDNIKSWTRGSERAPHKPLLILFALGEFQRGNTDTFSFSDIEEKVTKLLIDFGPARKNIRPEYPFIRLANDGIWRFNKPDLVDTSRDLSPSFLTQNGIRAGFKHDVVKSFQKDPKLIIEIAYHLLERNFPDSLFEDILQSVGINTEPYQKRKRNPDFRNKVLIAYEYKCAVCGFSVMLDNRFIALEAAHIKWFEANGPDSEENGIAFCTLHHKLFDFGAFTISKNGEILVSDRIHGPGSLVWLKEHHGNKINRPQRKKYYPEPEYTEWHANEVFKGISREY